MKIEIDKLSMVFEDGTPALKDIDLIIEDGVFGLLGLNASGKTTLMRILATLEKPTGGSVYIDGMDLQKNRAAIRSMTGFLPQRFSDFPKMTTWEFLDYTARLAGLRNKKKRLQEVDDMLESLGLYPVRDRQSNELPISMKRHLEIAQAIIGNPRLLIVDEPTVGLSPEERIRFRSLLAERIGKIDIIILSTHILGDISSACKDIAILDEGKIVYIGSPEKLLLSAQEKGLISDASDEALNNVKTSNAIVDGLIELTA